MATTPPEGEIMVDNQAESTCHSPCAIELASGQHTVRATKAGFGTLVKNVVVESDQQEIFLTLDQATGPLRIATVPEGATIVVITHEDTVAARASRVLAVRDGLLLSDHMQVSA
jgi:hypothetical protein